MFYWGAKKLLCHVFFTHILFLFLPLFSLYIKPFSPPLLPCSGSFYSCIPRLLFHPLLLADETNTHSVNVSESNESSEKSRRGEHERGSVTRGLTSKERHNLTLYFMKYRTMQLIQNLGHPEQTFKFGYFTVHYTPSTVWKCF